MTTFRFQLGGDQIAGVSWTIVRVDLGGLTKAAVAVSAVRRSALHCSSTTAAITFGMQ